MCHVVKNVHDIKTFVMTSISATCFKRWVMMSQTRQKHVHDITNTPWRQKICHDIRVCHEVKNKLLHRNICYDVKTLKWHQNICQNVKKFVMMSKTYHDVNKLPWPQKVHQKHGMMTKGLSWRQKFTIK